MVAVIVRDEHGFDRARVDPDPAHVREQGRATIKQEATIHHDCPVVSNRREGRPGPEERQLQAMVTDWLRYTSWIACSNSTPSFMGR